jgi:hypothetical protein
MQDFSSLHLNDDNTILQRGHLTIEIWYLHMLVI